MLDTLVEQWLTLPDLAGAVGESVSTVRQWLREGRLVAVRRGEPPVLRVPADLVVDGALVKGLAGSLSVLADSGFAPEEALRWLLTPDPSLPGRPVDALAEGRGREVRRRAQALAF